MIREAFWILSARRSMSGGQVPLPNPIAVADAFPFAIAFGLDPVHFLRVTSKAEELYIGEAASRAERQAKRAKKSRPR
jgi:hypothetical protein